MINNTTFWIQFIGMLFGLMMIYFTFSKYKRKEINRIELIVWFGCWLILIIIALIPSTLDSFIGKLHFYRRMDFFVVFGFFIILGLEFYNYCTIKKIELDIKKLEK